jgi:hypothetical protein
MHNILVIPSKPPKARVKKSLVVHSDNFSTLFGRNNNSYSK